MDQTNKALELIATLKGMARRGEACVSRLYNDDDPAAEIIGVSTCKGLPVAKAAGAWS